MTPFNTPSHVLQDGRPRLGINHWTWKGAYPSFGQTATLLEVSFTRLFPNAFQESPKGKFDNNAQIRSENRKIGPDLSDALKMLELRS
jgi:hypothetical protein